MGRPRDLARITAREAGESIYNGSSCYLGHDGRRYTCGGHCYQCQEIKGPLIAAKIRKTPEWKAYQKDYRAEYGKDPKNKERLREIQVRWYVKKHYNNDMDYYLRVKEEKEEKLAERKAHDAEVTLRRKLRELRRAK